MIFAAVVTRMDANVMLLKRTKGPEVMKEIKKCVLILQGPATFTRIFVPCY
jgi:hypothetical protein